jgi:hypothetical protein
MRTGARFERIGGMRIILTIIGLNLFKYDVEISILRAKVIAPYLDPKHEIVLR